MTRKAVFTLFLVLSASATARADLCASDPELQKIADENPEVAQCCQQFDAMLGNIDAILQQGFTALVPVLGCLTKPPIELSANCYNDLLSSGANCFYELNVMLGFFNATGLLDTAGQLPSLLSLSSLFFFSFCDVSLPERSPKKGRYDGKKVKRTGLTFPPHFEQTLLCVCFHFFPCSECGDQR